MTRITINVRNAEMVRKGLEDLTAEIPKIGRQTIYDAMVRIQMSMKKYPPTRPGQTYVRTYKLREGWVVVKREEMSYGINNQVPYTRYVVGDAYGMGQAWMHAGRWQIFRDVVDDEASRLPAEVERAISVVARRLLK